MYRWIKVMRNRNGTVGNVRYLRSSLYPRFNRPKINKVIKFDITEVTVSIPTVGGKFKLPTLLYYCVQLSQ